MGVYDAHGVVVVRVSSGAIHRADSGKSETSHGVETLRTGDWELFPNVVAALESENGYELCQGCFQSPRPTWLTVRR